MTSMPPDPQFAELNPKPVIEVLRALAAAMRSYRLYEGNNPTVDRFISTLQDRLNELWLDMMELRLDIEEDRILWEGHEVFPTADTGSELAFIFYKDGVREITLEPGFEGGEDRRLLRILSRVPSLREQEDDLVTLLWQQDFAHFRYRTVEAGDESAAALHEPSAETPQPISPQQVQEEEPERMGISTDEFQETLYFLDESELQRLREEIRRENDRDLWRDVLNALLDRIEDGDEERQRRVVKILGELLPSSLASAHFRRGAVLLEELVRLAGKPGAMSGGALRDVRDLFGALGTEETIFQLADILEESPDRLQDEAVLRLLAFFPPSSMQSLLKAIDRIEQPSVRRAFEGCIQRLAEGNREAITDMLSSEDPAVVAGALRWAGRLEIGSALSQIRSFLDHPEAEIRMGAIDALVSIRAATAGEDLIPRLEDPVRDVRIAAARAVAQLGFVGARSALEKALSSKHVREGDRVEKQAFFEAYGKLAGQEGVGPLSRILNARGGFLNRGESPEIRACAAIGLAGIRHPSAREALEAAADDPDPVVRTAVARALRGSAV